MRALTRMSMLALVAMLCSACETTTIRSAWYDPDFAAIPMAKIVVVGSGPSIAERRVFEDIFAQSLRDVGTQGVAGHTVLADSAWASDDAFNAAVTKSDAQGLLVVRLLAVDTRTNVTTTMAPAGRGWRGGRWGGGAWGPTMVPVTDVQQYQLATVDVSLFDVQSGRLVWAATTQTFNPQTVTRETPGFAKLIIGQLAARGIVKPAP
jgi:hypothetical protein